jgi:hypothetical protein
MSELTVVLGEARRCRRGSALTGGVRSSSEAIAGATLVVSWYTEGKGDRDEGLVHEIALATLPRKTAPDGSLELPFSLRLPLWPVTHHGEFIKIHWRVMVRLPGAEWQSEGTSVPFEVVL